MMNIQTRHFGEITVDESKKIVFKDGIPGFEELKDFIFIEEVDNAFSYLQSLQDGQVAFAIISPYILKPDYHPHIGEVYFEKLGGGESKEFSLYVIATVGGDMEQTTVNLQAPLLIHADRRLGVQAIVEDKEYRTRHKVVELVKERG